MQTSLRNPAALICIRRLSGHGQPRPDPGRVRFHSVACRVRRRSPRSGTFDCLLEISIAYLAAHWLLDACRQPDLYSALGRIHRGEAEPVVSPRSRS